MSDIQTLLTDNISDEEQNKAANNIIVNYELPLSVDQILLAFKNILDWLNNEGSIVTKNNLKNNRIHLLDKVLNINKNMFVAIILALCNNFIPYHLNRIMITNNCKFHDVGLNSYWDVSVTIKSYYDLLDHYEFDISNIPNIQESDKRDIQAYRAEKYPCKLTKCAMKK